MYRRASSRRNLLRFYGRAQKSWDQFDEYDSPELRCVRQTSEKTKVHRKIQVKFLHQRSPYAVKFEDKSREETERQERCAGGKAWNLAKNMYNLKEKDKATFYSPTNEWIMLAASTMRPEERKFVVVSGASMHVVSRKDLDSAELDIVKVSKKSDDSCNSARRGANKRRGNSVCQRIGFIRDSNAARRYTGSSFTRKTLRRSRV